MEANGVRQKTVCSYTEISVQSSGKEEGLLVGIGDS